MSRTPSYQRINYTLRPAKNIQRKMIAEACARLTPFMPVDTYRYVGFGSPFFSDFRLFHRALGFSTMINIEAERSDRDRFEFNRPFQCIKMIYGKSSEVLPTLRWKDLPTVIWLDYDCQLSTETLNDIGYLTATLQAPSLMIITVKSKPSDFGRGSKRILEALKTEFDVSLPPGIALRGLSESPVFSAVLRRIIGAKISEILGDRNAALPQANQFEYRQIFNFIYNDGTPMLTVGGMFIQGTDEARFESCGFGSLEYCKTGADSFEIMVPNLTFKEQHHLDSQLPGTCPQSPGVPKEDLEAYRSVYRYFPAFTEIEL